MKIAVIPARGGSKRIPLKNIRVIGGRPLLAWPIEAAIRSGVFERIIVSTDHEAIAEAARAAGAEVPFIRPSDLSNDHCGTLEVVRHAACWAQAEGLGAESICCLYPTALFTRPQDLVLGLQQLESSHWDYVFVAARFTAPVQRAFIRAADGSMRLLFPEHRCTRTQDLAETFHDVGQFYWGSSTAWREGRPIFGHRTSFVELPAERTQDIDTPEDWARAERLFRDLQESTDD